MNYYLVAFDREGVLKKCVLVDRPFDFPLLPENWDLDWIVVFDKHNDSDDAIETSRERIKDLL